jgi:hypothetical protein
MADDKGKEKKEVKGKGMPSNSEAFGELMKILLILIILSSLLGRLGAYVSGVRDRITAGVLSFGSSPVGTMISLAKDSALYDAPGGNIIGQLTAGMKGMITKGPIWKDGQRWWFVDFGNGLSGWVPESVLQKEDGSAFNPGDTPIGSRVAMSGQTSVLDAPGGKEIGTQPAGAKGVVTDGPVYKDGKRYWYVDFDSGPDGWVAETLLKKEDGSAFNPGDSPVGKQVATTGPLDVFDVPGGTSVGSQPAGAEGTIMKGPEFKDGKRWWYVDFESGPDGWVPEDMLTSANIVDPGSTPVGSEVATVGVTDILDAPGGVKIGEQPAGAKGTVTKGPEFKDGKRYWYVDFESGPDGWVAEDQIKNADGSPFNPGKTPIGSIATTAGNTVVRDAPAGTIIGGQPAGAKGTVTKGPVFKDGQRWWYMDFESGPDGWVAESDLRGPNGEAFDPGDGPVGNKVEMKRDAGVYDADGKKIGTQEKGARGVITEGPVYRDGQRYWYVDFESGPDGWVAEKDLAPYRELSTGRKILNGILMFLKILSWLIIIGLIIGIIVIVIRTNRVVSDMSKGIEPPPGIEIVAPEGNPAWKRVMDLCESDNSSDWKLSIIEADVMLDRMLQGMGYKGETIGDRLKAIEQSDFTTLDSAWDAHKVRNRIAHEGGDFLITQRETRRVIALYKQVFDEFRLL